MYIQKGFVEFLKIFLHLLIQNLKDSRCGVLQLGGLLGGSSKPAGSSKPSSSGKKKDSLGTLVGGLLKNFLKNLNSTFNLQYIL